MMSWMPTSASQPAQFPCDIPVQLFAPPVAVGPGALSTGQRRAKAGNVVAEHLVDALPVGRRLFEQPEGGVDDRRQVAAGEARVGEEVALDLFPRRLVVGWQRRCPGFERLPLFGEV